MPNPRSTTRMQRCIQLSIRGLLFEQLCFTQLYYGSTVQPAPDPPNLTTFLGLWEGTVMDMFLAPISQDYHITGLTARELTNPSRGGEFILPGDAGAVAQPALPSIVAVCVTWYTALFGKCGRGRTFWPGIPADATTEGVITNAYQTNMNLSVNNMLSNPIEVGGITYRLHVMSPASSNLEEGLVYGDQITSFTVRTSVSSVRRRKVGLGG